MFGAILIIHLKNIRLIHFGGCPHLSVFINDSGVDVGIFLLSESSGSYFLKVFFSGNSLLFSIAFIL